MQNTYQEKILDIETTNSSIKKKLEGGIKFKIKSDFQPAGDQPQAIKSITQNIKNKKNEQVLLGVTGSGKTFTMAHLIAHADRPTLVLSHNKTLAAQLYGELKGLFPDNAVEYFVSTNFSVETICCMTQHDVDAVSGLPNAALVSDAKLIPATLTAKYHLDAGAVKPYVGAGATYFWWVDVEPGADTIPLGVTRTTLSDELGLVLQAGADIAIGDQGLGLTLDAKRYFVDTTARWYAGDTLAIETEHKLDPWVLSAGVSYRF